MSYFEENIQNQRFFYMNNYVRTGDTVVVKKMDKNVKLMWRATGIEPKGDYSHALVDSEIYFKWEGWMKEHCP